MTSPVDKSAMKDSERQQNLRENMSKFSVSNVAADGLQTISGHTVPW